MADRHFWLRHVRQEGLIVSGAALEQEPLGQTEADTKAFEACKHDFWQIADKVLGWPADLIATRADARDLCEKRLTELGVTLWADAALRDAEDATNVRLLIRTLGKIDPDAKNTVEGWEGATQQQAFERLLRESGVEQGVLVTDDRIRLTYAPRGETPGYLEWPIAGMATTAGRPMLSGLKLLSSYHAIWGGEVSRLDGILRRSREHQNTVSAALAEQVLGALYTLMRGFTLTAEARQAMGELADRRPEHVYEGLLTVLLRLVFVLYAEDRDLVPSSEDEEARRIYDQGYSIRELFARLEADRSQYPDTMDDRYGAWGRVLALSRLIHAGAGKSFMHPRRGKLFDPGAYPFLEGRFADDDAAQVLPIPDGCIHDVLTQLLMLKGERLSYKTLDVEQIGSVYETMMGFVVTRTKGRSVALKVRPNAGSPAIPAFVNLEDLLAKAGKDRKKHLKDAIGFEASDAQNKLLKAADDIPGLLAALDRAIDERASPGKRACGPATIVLQPTDERRRSGSHYTPRTLTAPIVRDALAPIFAQVGSDAPPDAVLALKVCDPAMGSGAFLVEACRALGERLEEAWARHPALLPDEARADPHVFARREVAKRCLYGADKNPMATDLAKLSLWLVTLARDEDFSFLDHALKTGDSLVGLSVEQTKRLTWEAVDAGEDSQFMFAGSFDRSVDEAIETRRAIRSAPDNVTFEIQASRLATAEKALDAVKLAGDAAVGVFFSEKKPKARRDALKELHALLPLGSDEGWARARTYANSLGHGEHPVRPFHWQVEFPEVFAGGRPGFDAVVGNPPFAGKNTVAKGQRAYYPDWLKVISPGAHGNADLVAHFFRRAYGLLREGGAFGLIATNTIGQGDTRESGLWRLLAEDGGVVFGAQRRVRWPGAAAVVVSTVHMGKGRESAWPAPTLDGREVARVSAFLREGDRDETPAVLAENAGIAVQGSIILGMGFTFDDANAAKGKCEPLATMHALIEKDARNAERIKPYLGGEEVNTHPEHAHHRYVIDFEDFPLRRDDALPLWADADEKARKEMLREGVVPADYADAVAADWKDLLEIVERLVKPGRDRDKREIRRRKWWLHGDRQPALFDALVGLDKTVVTPRVKTHQFATTIRSDCYIANTLYAYTKDDPGVLISILNSRPHEVWMRVFSSTLGDALNYAPSDCFGTLPRPYTSKKDVLKSIGYNCLSYRINVMKARDEGLTKTYNRFHDPLDHADDIVELRRLHTEMDDAVLRAYGWDDLADACAPGAEFAPCFLTEDDEPEHAYQGRYFWPAPFRDKVLARLLAENEKRAKAEAMVSASPKAKTKARTDKQTGELAV